MLWKYELTQTQTMKIGDDVKMFGLTCFIVQYKRIRCGKTPSRRENVKIFHIS